MKNIEVLGQALSRSFADFFSARMLAITLLPFLCSLLLLILLSNYLGVQLLSSLEESVESKFLLWLLSMYVVKLLLLLLLYLLAYVASSFLALFISSFFTSYIAKSINAKHYQINVDLRLSDTALYMRFIMVFMKALALIILALFCFLIPPLAAFALPAALYYFYHNFLMLDILSCVLSRDEFLRYERKGSTLKCKAVTLVFYLFSAFSFFGIFTQVFFIIYAIHLAYLERNFYEGANDERSK